MKNHNSTINNLYKVARCFLTNNDIIIIFVYTQSKKIWIQPQYFSEKYFVE